MIELIGHKFYELFKNTLNDSFDVNHIYILVITTISLLFIEVIYGGWAISSLKKIKQFNSSTRNDLIAWIIETLNIYKIFSIFLSFGICYYLVGLIQKSIYLDFNISNSTIQFVLILVVSDLKNWISHYTFHRSNTLWQLHSFHHSATNFNILTRQRGHFLESELRRFFDIIPFVIFGAPISTYFFITILKEIH